MPFLPSVTARFRKTAAAKCRGQRKGGKMRVYLCRCLFFAQTSANFVFSTRKTAQGKCRQAGQPPPLFPARNGRGGGSPEGAEVQTCTLFSPLWALFGYFLARRKVTTSRPQTRREQRKKITLIFRQHRTNEVVGWRMDFSSDANANFEGLLAVNREICMTQMAEKTSPDAPPNCAVVP